MTTIALNTLAKRRQRERPEYRLLEKQRRNRKQEWEATKRRRATPEGWAKERIPKLKHRAKQQGLEFDLEWTDIIPPTHCPVFGIELDLNPPGKAYGIPNAPSVDRKNNSRGYVKGNVVVISNRANLLKKDGTVDEIRRLLKYMEGR